MGCGLEASSVDNVFLFGGDDEELSVVVVVAAAVAGKVSCGFQGDNMAVPRQIWWSQGPRHGMVGFPWCSIVLAISLGSGSLAGTFGTIRNTVLVLGYDYSLV